MIRTALLIAGMICATMTAAHAQQTTSDNPKGKHVILRVGPGFNPVAADRIADVLEREGCTAEVTAERGFPGHLTVEVDGFKPRLFRSIGSAGKSARDRCLGDQR
jgi:hypothetical protein